jgi:hypothetical protein
MIRLNSTLERLSGESIILLLMALNALDTVGHNRDQLGLERAPLWPPGSYPDNYHQSERVGGASTAH